MAKAIDVQTNHQNGGGRVQLLTNTPSVVDSDDGSAAVPARRLQRLMRNWVHRFSGEKR